MYFATHYGTSAQTHSNYCGVYVVPLWLNPKLM